MLSLFEDDGDEESEVGEVGVEDCNGRSTVSDRILEKMISRPPLKCLLVFRILKQMSVFLRELDFDRYCCVR